MPITTRIPNNTVLAETDYQIASGQTDGNEVIFRLDPGMRSMVEAFPTSGGSGTLKSSLNETAPTSFTNFSTDISAVSAPTTWIIPSGVRWIGLDIASGTWTVNVRQSRDV